jgi:peroxiredoxin 2/4
MTSLVTREAPEFVAQAVMADNEIAQLKLSDYRGKHVVLFFYPLDFTFVCPSEILAFDRRLDEFRAKGVEVLGISVDSQYTHLAWKQTPVERGGIGPIRYPLVADLDKSISRTFGVLSGEAVALRGLFLIDRNGIVRHQVVNDLNLGRSVDEAMRMVDALQFTEKYGDVCPADWQEGQEAMKPTAEGVAQYLAKRAN